MQLSATILVPVLNAERTVVELVEQLRGVLSARAADYEILLVDDGSTDRSWDLIERLAVEHREVRGIRLSRNFGQHNALLCGIRAARMDAIVTIDDDLQHPPGEVPVLLDALRPGVDLVYGRAERYRHGIARRLSMRSMKFAMEQWFRVPAARSTTSFRAFRTSLRDAFDSSPGRVFSLDAVLVSTTPRVTSVVVQHEPRRFGPSRHTLATLMRHVTDTIAGSSYSPLFFASAVGALALAAGSVGLLVVLVELVRTGSVAPMLPLAAVVGVLWGVTLIALGLIGSYLARILLSERGRPPFVIADDTRDAGGRCDGRRS